MAYFCKYCFGAGKRLESLFESLGGGDADRIVRLVFFTDADNNSLYHAQQQELQRLVETHFGKQPPVWSLVAEKPLFDGEVAVEVHCRSDRDGETYRYKQLDGTSYITVETAGLKELFVSVGGPDTALDSFTRAKKVFGTIGAVLAAENMEVHSILRQWNYVERITHRSGDYQNYQALNDARTEFYAGSSWPSGYPAATGIGVAAGGIHVDLNAATGVEAIPVDNPFQIAAHSYSSRVIVGEGSELKSTPKFERAKRVLYRDIPLEYISGTAAIRGEETLADAAIGAQTLATIENMRALMPPGYAMRSARVYVKHEREAAEVKAIVERELPGVDLIFVVADICRPELKVEIEALVIEKNTPTKKNSNPTP